MIFLFTLYYLFLHDNVLALPLHPTSEFLLYPRDIDPNRFTQRTEWNIIWSCFATIFSCSWVAIHPNIPAPSDSSMRIFSRRLMIMGYMLLLPEYMILWAGRQWFAARDIANKHKDRGWTSRTHGFFASMGGFMLYKNGVMTETLVIERLEELESKGSIDWPSISEKEIEDRSKGDAFSKGFAVLQATWFVTQCIARGAYGLVITELEVATLAYAVLNAILYFLWWNKPLGVACPVPVYFISSEQEAGTQTVASEYQETPDSNSAKFYTNSFTTSFRHPSAFVRYCVKFHDMVLFISGTNSDLDDMATCTTVQGVSALSVPTFYAPSCGTSTIAIAHRSAYIGFIIGTLFGGIHCIAWFFTFPSVAEQFVWRTSAATITALPIFFSGLSGMALVFKPKMSWMSWFVIEYVRIMMFVVYLVSRAALLVLPLIALRSLPPGSLLDIQWSSFIPHAQ